ncbi:ATP-binding protein [Pseudomonas putida]|uniref:AAA+ ATPase domain-containing protein n=1 Tax=Pseudomonas putida TaxID=303 RepID=A0A8I1ED23_PSEPU|nr:hypothetical protein [Pseudomonas putida]MBI6883127.1 hypothetical protein [Pseudomonas putida]
MSETQELDPVPADSFIEDNQAELLEETSLNYDMLARQQNGRLTPLILGGPPGAGKTHAAMSLRNDNSEPFARIAAAGKTKEDFTTYPIPEKDPETGIWSIAQPITESSLKALLAVNIKDGYGVLLVDDVTAADPSVQSALLELAQFGRIGEHQLGKNVAIVMTGNGVSDGAYAAQWSSALINRSHYIEYRASLEVWKQLPENENIDPIMYGFLIAYKEAFAPEVTKSAEKAKWFDEKGRGPSARQWTTLANSTVEKWGGMGGFKPNILFKTIGDYCASLIGSKAADALDTYAELMLKYPTAEKLIANPELWDAVPLEDKNQAGAVYAVAHSLRQYATNMNNAINEKYGEKSTSKKAEQEKQELLLGFSKAVAKLMSHKREMGAFCMRYLLLKAPADDVIKGLLADLVYDINDADPVLKDAGFDKILKSIKDMGDSLKP